MSAPRARNAVERALARWLIGRGAVEQAFLQLAILLKGDVPAAAALEDCAELSRGDLKAALYETARAVRGGSPLSKALARSFPWLGAIYAGLAEVGEANGSLPQTFSYAAAMLGRARRIRGQVLRAVAYPAVVAVAGLGVGYYVSAVAIPKIASVMGDPDRLPAVTKSLLSASAWVREYGLAAAAAPFAFALCWSLARKTAAGLWLDRLALRVPVAGKVGMYSANALFNHTMSALLASGIPVVESLRLAGGTLRNKWYRDAAESARRKVMAGRMLSAALSETALKRLSPLTPALAKVGESAGNMEEGLAYAGDFYEDALSRRLELMGKLVEPAMIVVVGGMVAYVYIAFFMGMAAMNAYG